MQSLTRDEFLEVLGLTSGAFDQLQHAGHVPLAFGTPLPATPGRYLDLDLVAMATNLGLTPALGVLLPRQRYTSRHDRNGSPCTISPSRAGKADSRKNSPAMPSLP